MSSPKRSNKARNKSNHGRRKASIQLMGYFGILACVYRTCNLFGKLHQQQSPHLQSHLQQLQQEWATFETEPPQNQLLRITTESASLQASDNQSTSPYAYAFLIAGCDPLQPSYIGFVYNVLVSSYTLRHSQADIVALIRMSSLTNHTILPPEISSLLVQAGVKIHYLPKPNLQQSSTEEEEEEEEDYNSAQMAKFHVLELVQYQRVLFLDADVMPLCNLDYLFAMSHGPNATLAPNVILARKATPANGGFFMVAPQEGDFARIQRLMQTQKQKQQQAEEEALIQGWGHQIHPPDHWQTLAGDKGTQWTFHAALVDQGLLYHWVKYVKKDVSIILGPTVQRWKANPNRNSTQVQLQPTIKVEEVQGIIPGCNPPSWWKGGFITSYRIPPYNDHVHFFMSYKPWVQDRRVMDVDSYEEVRDAYELWFFALKTVLKEQNRTLVDMEGLRGRPVLGFGQAPEIVKKEKLRQKQKEREREREREKEKRRRKRRGYGRDGRGAAVEGRERVR